MAFFTDRQSRWLIIRLSMTRSRISWACHQRWNPGPVVSRRMAADEGTFNVFIPVLFDGTLTTGSGRTHTRMPTKIREGQAPGTDIPATDYWDLLRTHSHRQQFLPSSLTPAPKLSFGQAFVMCSLKSSSKYLRPLPRGAVAPGARAQNVRPGPM